MSLHINPRIVAALGCCCVLSCAHNAPTQLPLTRVNIEEHLRRGEAALRDGKFDSARVHFLLIRETESNNLRAVTGLDRIAFAQHDWDEALTLAKQGLKLDSLNLSCHYIGAVSSRELGTELMSQNKVWKFAEAQFTWILRVDSAFEDVLYQYALLERYQEHRDHALELTRAQIARRPDLLPPQLGLYNLHKYFMATEEAEEFQKWLQGQHDKRAQFFLAEFHRRHDNLVAADSLLTVLLHSPGSLSPQAIRLSRARIRFQQGDSTGAETEYWSAVREIRTPLGAALVFEDIKYIVSDMELAEYLTLTSVTEWQEFFRKFWEFRSPSLALRNNLRLLEHMRRFRVAERQHEYYGFRTRFNNPDMLHELKFPRAFALNEEFNDKGLIYLRQGEPDDILREQQTSFEIEDDVRRTSGDELDERMATVAESLQPIPRTPQEEKEFRIARREKLRAGMFPSSREQDPCESWLYNATSTSPRLIIHFQKHNAAGNCWRLSPSPSLERMVEDLLLWDKDYSRFFTERETGRATVQAQVIAESKSVVDYGLSTEKQTWEKKKTVFRFPHAVDMFRAPGGRTLLDISYAIPIGQLAQAVPESVRSIPVEIGYSLVDRNSVHRAMNLDTIQVNFPASRAGAILDLVRYTVPPDSYSISMHIRALQGDMLGTWRQSVRVRDFSRTELMVSSIQLLRPSTDPSSMVMDGIKVVQSPFSSHVRTGLLYVYFHIYHLVADDFGNTLYTVSCILLSPDASDLTQGKVISEVTKKGREESAAEFYQLDVSSVSPGKYRFAVVVTDYKRVKTLVAEREIRILKP
jgi:hypothetical protein